MGQHTHYLKMATHSLQLFVLSYWQAVAHIFISCQIRVCSSWETKVYSRWPCTWGGGLGVLPLGGRGKT